MISINGIELDNDLVWDNEFDTPAVPQHVVETLVLLPVFQELDVPVKRKITLVALLDGEDIYGHFLRSQIKQLRLLEGGDPVVFIFEDQTLEVKILAGGIRVRPRIARPNHEDNDMYFGTIQMMEV